MVSVVSLYELSRPSSPSGLLRGLVSKSEGPNSLKVLGLLYGLGRAFGGLLLVRVGCTVRVRVSPLPHRSVITKVYVHCFALGLVRLGLGYVYQILR